jgi:hypothetical protein
MFRNVLPWLPFIAFAAIVAVLAVVHVARTPRLPDAPTPLPPGPAIEPARFLEYLANVLRSRGPFVSVVPCEGRPGFYRLREGEPASAGVTTAVEVRPEEASLPLSTGPGGPAIAW